MLARFPIRPDYHKCGGLSQTYFYTWYITCSLCLFLTCWFGGFVHFLMTFSSNVWNPPFLFILNSLSDQRIEWHNLIFLHHQQTSNPYKIFLQFEASSNSQTEYRIKQNPETFKKMQLIVPIKKYSNQWNSNKIINSAEEVKSNVTMRWTCFAWIWC